MSAIRVSFYETELLLRETVEKVQEVRSDDKMEVSYMMWQLKYQDAVEEGRLEGRAEGQLEEKYEFAKKWYDTTYEKQDKISYLKTEELMNLAYRILEHDQSVEIVNDINVQGDYLGIKIK